MSHFLTKLLPMFIYPLGLSIILCFSGFILLQVKRRKSSLAVLLLSMLLLWVASTRKAAELIMASLEDPYPPKKAEAMPQAEAIVILGGATRGEVPGLGLADLNDGADRIVHGVRLFLAGKAPLIILSGGGDEGKQPEAEAMAELTEFMGVPAESTLLEPASRNTWENGENTSRILLKKGIRRILLVTSASHMRRAQAIFSRLGFSVVPAATDYQIVEKSKSIFDWLPQAEALEMTTKGIKEHVGWWIYSLRAWKD